jgi:hypothetical protein
MSLWNIAAWGSQTPAAKAMAAKRSGRAGGLRSARRRKKATTMRRGPARRKATRAKTRTRSRMVKGSAAAKRYMASIRRKRRK